MCSQCKWIAFMCVLLLDLFLKCVFFFPPPRNQQIDNATSQASSY